MKSSAGFESSLEGKYIASIDFGSHTARFLLGKICAPPALFKPVLRKRVYTNLAEGFNKEGSGVINPDAVERAINAISDFKAIAGEYSVKYITGAATGIMRRSENGHDLLNKIREATNIEINVVSGKKEASLTLQGISHALKLEEAPDTFFDLGGSTTEIILKRGEDKEVYSLSIGAFVLTEQHLKHDPPEENEIDALKQYVNSILCDNIAAVSKPQIDMALICSGGTVTSLAAMAMNFEEVDVTPERINGVTLNTEIIQSIYDSIRLLSYSERCRLKGIDEGRAKVFLAGIVVVIAIMKYFGSKSITVSYSDILEGLLISYLKGEKNE